uniref:NADH dehydrogenase subunit 4L n=1 Tax=Ornithodoros improvisus TaxID=2952141 RepID=UPI00286CFE96|nr:NADH dehydrogenase subunit 4L [Ornithodoros improvisus]WKW52636.1 NADH dehydrogenase subunit 4L [Ornithodoros improvisus]
MLSVGLFIYAFGLMSIFLNRKHILILLLCLEFMYLGVLFNIFMLANFDDFFVNVIIFMILVVCEAGMGLCILVASVYYYGNDKLKSMILLNC